MSRHYLGLAASKGSVSFCEKDEFCIRHRRHAGRANRPTLVRQDVQDCQDDGDFRRREG